METDVGVHDDATTAAAVCTGGEGYATDPESRTDADIGIIRDVTADLCDASVEAIRDSVLVDDETDAISLIDTVMSFGRSSSDDDQSPSSCGLSVSTSGNRKRFAEGSPEREEVEGTRREFPGRVTRSAGGCRVYVPTNNSEMEDILGRILNDDGTVIQKVTLGQDNRPETDGQAGTTATDRRAAGDIGAHLGITQIMEPVVSGQPSLRTEETADTWLMRAHTLRARLPVSQPQSFRLRRSAALVRSPA